MTTAPVAATSAASRPDPARPGDSSAGSPIHLVIVFLMLVWLIPTIGLLVNSLRPPAEVSQVGLVDRAVHPSQLTLDNYRYVLAQDSITSGFINSLFISIPATIIPIMVAAFAAYAFAWMSFPAATSCSSSWSACWSCRCSPRSSRSCSCTAEGAQHRRVVPGGLAGAHGYGLPFAIFLLRNSWAACRARSSSPPRSTARAR